MGPRSSRPLGEDPTGNRADRATQPHPVRGARCDWPAWSDLTGAAVDATFSLIPPLYSDHGLSIRVGRNVFINQACTLNDIGGIEIGDDVIIGPRVSLITSGHPLDPGRDAGRSWQHRSSSTQRVARCRCDGLAGRDRRSRLLVAAGAVVTRDVPPERWLRGCLHRSCGRSTQTGTGRHNCLPGGAMNLRGRRPGNVAGKRREQSSDGRQRAHLVGDPARGARIGRSPRTASIAARRRGACWRPRVPIPPAASRSGSTTSAAPAAATRAALTSWSANSGTITSGTPAASVPNVVPDRRGPRRGRLRAGPRPAAPMLRRERSAGPARARRCRTPDRR